MIAPRKMKPPKMATAMIPSRLYLALARVLWDLTGVGLKLASTFPAPVECWWCWWLIVVVVCGGCIVDSRLPGCWFEALVEVGWTLIELVVASGLES